MSDRVSRLPQIRDVMIARLAGLRQLVLDPRAAVELASQAAKSDIMRQSALGWIARILQMGFQVLSVRLIMEALGANGYAGVVLLAGLMGWLANIDFGFSYGFLNAIPVAKAKGQSDAGLRMFALACYIGFSVIGVILAIIVCPLVADVYLAAVPMHDRGAEMTVSVIVLITLGTAAIGNRLLFADQKITLYYLLSLLATSLSTGCIVLMHYRFLPVRVDVVVVSLYLPQVLTGLWAVVVSIKSLQWSYPTAEEARTVVTVSLKFFLLNLLTLLTIQTDTFIISQRLPAHDISVYGLYTRLFTAMNLLITTPLGVLWPRFTMHAVRGEHGVTKRLLKSYIGAAITTMTLFGIFMYFCNQWVIDILAPHQHIVAPPYFILALTLLQVSILWTGAFHTAVISMSVLVPALVLTPLQAAIAAAGEWTLAGRYGALGVTCGMLISYLIVAVWTSPTVLWFVIRRQRALQAGRATASSGT